MYLNTSPLTVVPVNVAVVVLLPVCVMMLAVVALLIPQDQPVGAFAPENVNTETQEPDVALLMNPAAFVLPVPIVPQVPTEGVGPKVPAPSLSCAVT